MTKDKFLSCVFKNEDQFSAATYQYINFNYPLLRRYIFHVPNEGARSKIEATKLQAMGVIAGIPDYICVKPLFALELKMPNGKLSPKQKEIQGLWSHMPYKVAYTPIEVVEFLNTIFPPQNQKMICNTNKLKTGL